MQHKDFLVDLIDEKGRVVGQKPRHAINKKTDLYHAVHILLLTPDNDAILSVIPDRSDLPNLYSQLFGTTVATIKRSHETIEQAAHRALANDLFLKTINLKYLGDSIINLPGVNKPYYMSVFAAKALPPIEHNQLDIEKIVIAQPLELDKLVEAQQVSPTLEFIWKNYRQVLLTKNII